MRRRWIEKGFAGWRTHIQIIPFTQLKRTEKRDNKRHLNPSLALPSFLALPHLSAEVVSRIRSLVSHSLRKQRNTWYPTAAPCHFSPRNVRQHCCFARSVKVFISRRQGSRRGGGGGGGGKRAETRRWYYWIHCWEEMDWRSVVGVTLSPLPLLISPSLPFFLSSTLPPFHSSSVPPSPSSPLPPVPLPPLSRVIAFAYCFYCSTRESLLVPLIFVSFPPVCLMLKVRSTSFTWYAGLLCGANVFSYCVYPSVVLGEHVGEVLLTLSC